MHFPVIILITLIASVFPLTLKAKDLAVRLVGGGTANFQGRVEVRLEGSWGRVCGVKWDIQDANVVCRQLGYEGTAVDPEFTTFGPGEGHIWMDNVQCVGNESSLLECKHDRWGGFRCGTDEDARTVCKPAARLVEGKSVGKGLVQVYYNNSWRWVCADQWDKHAADVVCRMMGFYESPFVTLISVDNEQLHDSILLSNVQCTGVEDSIFSCPHDDFGLNNRACNRNVLIRCDDAKDVRLVGGGTIFSQGRVELYRYGIWGTICRKHYWAWTEWGLAEANVVCRQLGYDGALMVPGFEAFGTGKGVTWVNTFDCDGDEKSITTCDHNVWTEACNCFRSREHSSAICTSLVRLLPGPSVREGFVQAYYNKTWGWICDQDWDKKDADVVCRMLGFEESSFAVYNGTNASCGEESGVIWLNNVPCSGTERSLFSCVHDEWRKYHCTGKCAMGRKAGVVCNVPKVRLVGGKHRWEGTVELLYSGIWGSVCDNNWDIKDANAVCRQLGYKGAEAAPRRSAFGTRSGKRWMDQVQCKGNESAISECVHNGWGVIKEYCYRKSLASVVCHQQDEPETTLAPFCSSSPVVCKKGTNCTLICQMPGTGAIEYHWTKDGKTIDFDHIIISNNVLVVSPQTNEDYGEFTCQAFDSAGYARSCKMTLTEMSGGEIPFLPITITLSCALFMAIVVNCWLLIRLRRQLNTKAPVSGSAQQETRQDPHTPDKVETGDLHVRTAQAQVPNLDHEYQPLRHGKNDFPNYENVECSPDKLEQIDGDYEEVAI